MDLPGSEYSGGGGSGWTMYLEQSYVSKDDYCGLYGGKKEEEEEEEDLSMVSDASSGPRYYEDDEYCYGENGFCLSSSCTNELANKKEDKKKNKNKNKQRCGDNYQKHSCLDDTASSPAQGFAEDDVSIQNPLGISQGFSATKLKGKSSFRKQFGFLKSGKHVSEEKGLQRRSRE